MKITLAALALASLVLSLKIDCRWPHSPDSVCPTMQHTVLDALKA